MMLWRSVVGKLWITIILLVSFVLFILTVMLLEFFENYHIDETDKGLEATAIKISRILEEHDQDIGLEIAWELIDDVTKVIIIKEDDEYYYSPNHLNDSEKLPISYLRDDDELNQVFTDDHTVRKISSYFSANPEDEDEARALIIGVPLPANESEDGAVFIYQSIEVMQETTKTTTKFILLAAGVAIILTTIFAFFLSTRITAPLRKMREAVSEAAKGKFDTKVPFLSYDEIGELATAFNQMGRQLKFNMDALSQEKEQLASILSGMADGVITFNRDGTILITNPPAERFLQSWYFEKGSEHNHTSEAVPSKVSELFQLAVSTEKEQVGELSIQGRFWVMIISPLYNQKNIRGAVAVIRDMTEERQLDKLRKDFIANVSHELRTPIAMMQGYSEAIVDNIASTEEEKNEMIKVIHDESLRMGRLVNELLDLARMEAGHIQLTKEQVDVTPFIQKIIRKFQGLAKEKGISLGELLQGDYVFMFDPDRLEQVLTNLIDNAMRHTPERGTISVASSMDERGLYMEVADSGSGIPEEDLPFIFERFYKEDKARTRGRSGTGLGLAIAKNIIDAHKGHITVQSRLGHGTTFSIFIPRNIE